MKDIARRWVAVAVAVSTLLATAGVGGAQVGAESVDSTVRVGVLDRLGVRALVDAFDGLARSTARGGFWR